MPSLARITTSPDLTFDALVDGEPGAPLVLLLHGFAESMNCWLDSSGYCVLSSDERVPKVKPELWLTAICGGRPR